jgi:hypothetical protein
LLLKLRIQKLNKKANAKKNEKSPLAFLSAHIRFFSLPLIRSKNPGTPPESIAVYSSLESDAQPRCPYVPAPAHPPPTTPVENNRSKLLRNFFNSLSPPFFVPHYSAIK